MVCFDREENDIDEEYKEELLEENELIDEKSKDFQVLKLDRIIRLTVMERDGEFIEPFCIVAEEKSEKIHIMLSYNSVISLAKLLKPYLENHESQIEIDNEVEKIMKKEAEHDKN